MEDEKKKKRSKKNKQTKQAEDIACGVSMSLSVCFVKIGEGLDEDLRLKVFKKEWFQCKNGLDIGCNSGIITIQIAKTFQCRRILGIDIDSSKIFIIPEFF
ncbi:hypothetical protein Pint_17856 [Pistacia integerrima]|uniref:Uncharacterized protein n=1 Tax=Pistacia integerrima TaxID=434235 RepID=A0ACC0YZD8_9ROSI|nr:hypothetical protein Pint_17856 [Pistacia integerrima]